MTSYTHLPALELSNSLRTFLKKASQSECTSDKLKDKCLQILNSGSQSQVHQDSPETERQVPRHESPIIVPTNIIIEVYKCFKDKGEKVYLHEAVSGSDFVLQSPVRPPPNPDYVAKIEQLKILEENREYKRITRNVDQTGGKTFTFQEDVKGMNRQLTGVLNFVLTVVSGFAFGYKAVEFTFGNNFPMQMMAGLIVATVIFFVDLYFLLKYSPI